ncbi:MAG: transglycosylase SLT domain-containing protein [Neisseriaceae bacterium]|nr:transglycosylase SLT domain-containing protein [Neisseriaceae bacterium]
MKKTLFSISLACLVAAQPSYAWAPVLATDVINSILKLNHTRLFSSDVQLDATLPLSWERVSSGFQMNEVNANLVRAHEAEMMRNPAGLQRSLERGKKYLPYILAEVERRGLPTELSLLPVVESAFVPRAKSQVGASGLWQFMPETGVEYGLEQTIWYDGRRDVVESTRAALDYLEKLYGMFGSWDLALAAYNWGQGSVSKAQNRAIALGVQPDYENINMPKETRNYVPKLLAVRNIVGNPARYGVQLPFVSKNEGFVALPTRKHMDLALAAQFADMSVEAFSLLNPAYNLAVMAHKPGRQILIPKDKLATFESNLKNWSGSLMSYEVYVPKSSTSAASLGREASLSTAALQAANNGRSVFPAGQPVLVPKGTLALLNAPAPRTEPAIIQVAASETIAKPALIEVGMPQELTENTEGFTPTESATTPSISSNQLQRLSQTQVTELPVDQGKQPVVDANTKTNFEGVDPIAQLALTQPNETEPVFKTGVSNTKKYTPIESSRYVVQDGDTLSDIALRAHQTLPYLMALNGLITPLVDAGQILKVKGQLIVATAIPTETEKNPLKTVSYIVQDGDTVYSIARKFGLSPAVLRELNKVGNNNKIVTGQKMIIQSL